MVLILYLAHKMTLVTMLSCYVRKRLREEASLYIDSQREKLVRSPRLARSCFCELGEITVHRSRTHSHSIQAENRCIAVNKMKEAAQKMGRRLFMLQCASRDQEANVAGSRVYYWMKDTDAHACLDEPLSGDVVGIVDTDYYLDMPYLLSKLTCPVMIYTMTPQTAGEINSDGLTFSFNDASEISAKITGGSTYTHALWNYGGDIVVARRFWGLVTQVWNMDTRFTAKHSSLVFLTPRDRWTGIASLLTTWMFGCNLDRIQIAENGWSTMRVLTSVAHTISIARTGSPVSATIPVELDEGLRSTVENTKMPLTISSVESQVSKQGLTHAQSAMLCSYYRSVTPMPELTVYPVQYSIKRFQHHTVDLDVKPAMTPFMSPIINDAYVPDKTLGNEQNCLDERVKKIASPILPMTPDYLNYVDEFIRHVVPVSGTLVPCDETVVWEKQSSPTQQRLLEEASQIDLPKKIVKCFQKSEAYGKQTAPRNISTINPKDKLGYSRVVYAISEMLKTKNWYAFGKVPSEIARRVAQICQDCRHVIPSDFSRLDGTISNLCRHLEKALFMRAFAPEYHEEVEKLMKSQHHCKGIGMFGTWYETLWSRLSGSPETSACNSIVTAFTAYVGYRLMGYTPEMAYVSLGIYGGDDGLSPDMDPSCFKAAAEMLGLKLTCEMIRKGEPKVHFLARVYTPEVWWGNSISCCDLKRQLSKFHLCVPSSLTDPVKKLTEKGFSYYLTDKFTPIIGPLVMKIKELMDKEKIVISPTVMTRDKSYSSLAEEDDQYPNEPHEWFETYALEVVPSFDEEQWLDWLDASETFEALLSPPCLLHPETPPIDGIAINGEAPPMIAVPAAISFIIPPAEYIEQAVLDMVCVELAQWKALEVNNVVPDVVTSDEVWEIATRKKTSKAKRIAELKRKFSPPPLTKAQRIDALKIKFAKTPSRKGKEEGNRFEVLATDEQLKPEAVAIKMPKTKKRRARKSSPAKKT